jgi:RNA recognition motif-containing protein
MGNRIYVGNLSYNTTDEELRSAFATHGEVVSANIMVDRMSGRSRGFGFVEMATEDEAKRAIDALHGTVLDNRTLTVNEAREREPMAPRGGGGSSAAEAAEAAVVAAAVAIAAIGDHPRSTSAGLASPAGHVAGPGLRQV